MGQPLKDLFDAALVDRLARDLAAPSPPLDPAGLPARVLPALLDLPMKARVDLLADALAAWLPGPYPAQVARVLAALGPPAALDRPNAADFGCWPLATFVERHGLGHFEPSMQALHALTQRFSAEFAVRPYLAAQPERTLAVLATWAADPSPHVRRLVSEGTRPRLPWGARLRAFQRDPSPTLALLERLRDDPHPTVRRSVANHLGDVAKDHPDRAVAVLQRWLADDRSAPALALARHALRHPVKQGHPAALRLLGLDPGVSVRLQELQVSPRVVLGEGLLVEGVLLAPDGAGTVELDLVLHLRRAAGHTAPKVFKGLRCVLPAGQPVPFRRRLPLRAVTTRTHHAGPQRVEIQVNGRILGGAGFELVVP